MTKQLVFGTVGTDKHPFNRLVKWLDDWSWKHSDNAQVFLQYGFSKPPQTHQRQSMLTRDEIEELYRTASVVVCAGGPGTIMDALAYGSKPIVVPRLAQFGEHINDHQLNFARFMSKQKLITIATNAQELNDLLDRALVEADCYRVDPQDVTTNAALFVGTMIDRLVDG